MFILNMIAVSASCNLLLSSSKKDLSNTQGFKCFGATKIQTPVRLTATGDIECFSVDGKECSTNFKNDFECRSYILNNIGKFRSVVCQPEAYNKKGSWCRKAHKYFYKRWQCEDDTGLNVAIRLNKKTFNVECLSKDGKSCLTGLKANKACTKANNCDVYKKKVRPVSCDKSAYTQTEHNWCKRGFAFFRHSSEFLCKDRTGLNTAVRLSKNGNVQCLSTDGRNCIWNLDTTEKCVKAVLETTQGGEKKIKGLSCGKVHAEIYGGSGYDNPKHWCHIGYTNLFTRVQKQDPEIERKVRKIKDNFLPKWFHHIKQIIQTPAARTQEGLNKIKEILKKHDFKFKIDRWDEIKKNIANGSKEALKKVTDSIKIYVPSLPKPPSRLPQPTFLDRLADLLRSTKAQGTKGIKKIKQIIRNNGVRIHPSRWKWIVNQIKTGKVKTNPHIFKSVIGKFRGHHHFKLPRFWGTRRFNWGWIGTNRYRYIGEGRKRHIHFRFPRWYIRIIKFIRTAKAKTEEGLNKIKQILTKNKFNITPARWNQIKVHIKTGNKNGFKQVIKTIKIHTPQIKRIIKSKIGGHVRHFRFPRWYIRFIKFMRTPKARTEEGLNKIKQILTKNKFNITPARWNQIKVHIKTGNKNGFKQVIKTIKIHTPQIKRIVKELRIREGKIKIRLPWYIRIKQFIKTKAAKTEQGLRRIKSVLAENKFKFTPTRWNNIKNKILKGTDKGFKSIIRCIRNYTPKIKNIINMKIRKGNGFRINFPKWFSIIKTLITKPIARTKKGLQHIKQVLKVHKFKLTPSIWNQIKNKIKTGNKHGFRWVIKTIKTHTPEIKKMVKNNERMKLNFTPQTPKRWIVKPTVPKVKGPKWFQWLVRFVQNPESRTREGIKKIKNVLRVNDFRLTTHRWVQIKHDIKSGNIIHTPSAFKNFIYKVKKHTPALKPSLRLIRIKEWVPKWFINIKKFIKTAGARTKEGLNRIKQTIKRNNGFLTKDEWSDIKSIIKGGKVQDPRIFKYVVNKIKHNVPVFDNTRENSGSSITLRVNGKKCGSSFFRKLVKMLKNRNCKTKKGLKKIKKFMNSHFRVSRNTWKRIKRAILAGTLNTKDGRIDVVGQIKSHIPNRYLENRHIGNGHKWIKKGNKKENKYHSLESSSSSSPPRRIRKEDSSMREPSRLSDSYNVDNRRNTEKRDRLVSIENSNPQDTNRHSSIARRIKNIRQRDL